MDAEGNKSAEAKPGGEVLKTAGEASAAGYAEAEVREATDCPTIEVDRVRIVPPTQTPTVKLADRAKGSGPRAPEQMVKPTPKGAVELPEGRPVTKMQVIEIDPEFLLELETRRERERTGREAAGSGGEKEAPPAVAAELAQGEGALASPVSAAVKERPARGAVLVAAAVLLTALVLETAATRGPKPGEKTVTSAAVTSAATVAITRATASQAAMVIPAAPSTDPSAAVPSPTAAQSAAAKPGAAPAAIKSPGKSAATIDHPYDAPTPNTAAPVAPPPPPASAKTASTTPTASPRAGNVPEF